MYFDKIIAILTMREGFMTTHSQLANAIRFLSIDAIQQANSGHPGMPMGMADIATVLWRDFLRFNPKNPKWINRDRFVLSNGHGSMLQYSLLHLTGYDLSIDDLKHFRQLHSRTPGHPEVDETPGIETTTGPLGQGLANGVGMALAEKLLAAHYNQKKQTIIDHHTYVFAGDGCLMEGISHEVCSLAGTWELGKLIVFYDDNGISIDGETKGWMTEDVPARFQAYRWHVIPKVNGHDPIAIKAAIDLAKSITDKPTLICCQTEIGFGSPHKANTAEVHGSPLGDEEIILTREKLEWPYPPFEIPQEIYDAFDAREKGEALEAKWQEQFDAYSNEYPELAEEILRRFNEELPGDWEKIARRAIETLMEKKEKVATRKASQQALNLLAPALPELIGGAADLTPSTLTDWNGCRTLTEENDDANYIHYGVREFGMSAIMNGLTLHGGMIPFGGTFLVFYTYAANAIRMAALMKKRVIFVYTHDSIGLGEDGPTHQPIEQLDQLRAIPNIVTWRPCDAVETVVAWQMAIENRHQPSALLLSRQGLPSQLHDSSQIDQIKRGGYIILECTSAPKKIIIATGSEVVLAVEAATQLNAAGDAVRVVSMPSPETFLAQEKAYQENVLPASIKARVAVEAGTRHSWYRFANRIIGIEQFGLSAPAGDVQKELGLTVDKVIEAVRSL